MNTPNKLTVLRIAMTPIFLFFLLADFIPHNALLAAAVFAMASITDAVDGKLARRNNQITTFGKFLDPLADKVLVTCALVGFVELGLVSAWFVVLIIAREFLVTSLRLVAAGGGEVIAASIWGKMKTVSQMVAILTIILLEECKVFFPTAGVQTTVTVVDTVLISIATLTTIISGIQYMWQYREHINTTK